MKSLINKYFILIAKLDGILMAISIQSDYISIQNLELKIVTLQ